MIAELKENPELWDLFTRAEEYAPFLPDQYGRFPYYRSRHRDLTRPVVSEYLVRRGLRAEYPEGKPFAVCLTHDIDTVRYNVWHWGYETAVALRKRRFADGLRVFTHRVSRRINPLWNFAAVMNLEARYGAASTFFFLALAPGEEDFNFRIEQLAGLLRAIHARGWEVGLHGGHEAWRRPEDLLRQKDRLERALGHPVQGYRNHYLRFAVPTTWRLLAEAGFAYDSTLGYADCVGFRNGMCHPFRPYDRRAGRFLDLWEIPLVVMDCTLDSYMHLDERQAWDQVTAMIDTGERLNGVITLLWHNTHLIGGGLEFYERILQYARGKNAWLTSAGALCEWWARHDFLGQGEA